MTPAAELILRAKLIREKLRNPPNAVKDSGLNLHPIRVPKEDKIRLWTPLPPKTRFDREVLEHRHLKDIVKQIPKCPDQAKTMLAKILSAVCRHYEVMPSDIGSKKMQPVYVRARHVTWYLAHKYARLPRSRLAHIFEIGDHSTVCRGVENIVKKLPHDESLRYQIMALEIEILGQTPTPIPADAPKSTASV